LQAKAVVDCACLWHAQVILAKEAALRVLGHKDPGPTTTVGDGHCLFRAAAQASAFCNPDIFSRAPLDCQDAHEEFREQALETIAVRKEITAQVTNTYAWDRGASSRSEQRIKDKMMQLRQADLAAIAEQVKAGNEATIRERTVAEYYCSAMQNSKCVVLHRLTQSVFVLLHGVAVHGLLLVVHKWRNQ
jgi:hypothetical protein